MSPARARTTRSGVESTKHEATVPATECISEKMEDWARFPQILFDAKEEQLKMILAAES